jgi:two-component system, NarL family, response regulator
MKDSAPIRILIADDHHLMRLGLMSLLGFEDSIEICGFAEDGQQAVDAYRRHMPDVVLMDLRLPVMDGAEATRAIRTEFPGARILILSTFDADQDIRRAIQAGAAGYLVKNASPDELVAAIRRIHRGEAVYSGNIGARLGEINEGGDLSERQSGLGTTGGSSSAPLPLSAARTSTAASTSPASASAARATAM